MPEKKKACLIYVRATESAREEAAKRLSQQGYSVCEVEAELDDAVAAKAGERALPPALSDCINSSDICVFLLPEKSSDDGLMGDAARFANQRAKRMVGVIAGGREKYPQDLDDDAFSMIRVGSKRFDTALGDEIWEKPDRSLIQDRKIKHIKCQ